MGIGAGLQQRGGEQLKLQLITNAGDGIWSAQICLGNCGAHDGGRKTTGLRGLNREGDGVTNGVIASQGEKGFTDQGAHGDGALDKIAAFVQQHKGDTVALGISTGQLKALALSYRRGSHRIVNLQGRCRDLPLYRGASFKAKQVTPARTEACEVKGFALDRIQRVQGKGDAARPPVNDVVLAISREASNHTAIGTVGIVRQHEIRDHLARSKIGAASLGGLDQKVGA